MAPAIEYSESEKMPQVVSYTATMFISSGLKNAFSFSLPTRVTFVDVKHGCFLYPL
jgi:hypothetical protein